MENAIEIRNVSVYYHHICALSDINLNVKTKDFLGIIGPNGGGKSTLLKTILGLIIPQQGEISVFGRTPPHLNGIVGYVPQTPFFDKFYPINVFEVVLMGRLAQKKGTFIRYSKEDKQRVTNILKKLNLYHLKDRPVGQLSGGQLKRVYIARALAVEPKIIILDEPTAGLDAPSASNIYNFLQELNKELTILIVTHDISAISSFIKNLACLNTKLYYHGEPLLNSNIIKETYGCPVELLAHGVPHRVLKHHEEEDYA